MPGFEPEPTNYQIMAAIKSLAEGQQALAEAMSTSFAHLATEISGVKADIGSLAADVADVKAEIRAVEAGLISRIDSVQQVVRSVKADIARHMDDGDAHHRHAA